MRNIFVQDSFTETSKAIGLLPKKQITLFAAQIARSVLPIWEAKFPEDKRPIEAIIAAENFSKNKYAAFAASAAFAAANAAAFAANGAAFAAASAANAANGAANAAAFAVIKWDWMYNLYLQCHREYPFEKKWKTKQAVLIAKNIIINRDFEIMPILADALEDEGYLNYDELHFLRHGSEYWGLSNWLLFNLGIDE